MSTNPMNELSGTPFWKSALSFAAIAGGIVLVVLSLIWPSVSIGRAQWSDDRAHEYQRVSAQLHGLSHQFADQQEQGRADDALAEKLHQAQAEFNQLHQQLQVAQQSPLRIASLMRLLGLGLIVVGAIPHYWHRIRKPA